MKSEFLALKNLHLSLLAILYCHLSPDVAMAVSPQASDALAYLRQKMDQFTQFDVYADAFSVGNHFEPTGWMGDAITPGVVTFKPDSTETWHTGGNSIKIAYSGGGANGWAGIYWQHPGNNWGTIPTGGFNLGPADRLTFWARGKLGGEKIEFKMGGITGAYGDSVLPALSTGVITLTTTWRQYSINLIGKNLSRVVGGFVWVAKKANNPQGATFYLDDIRYQQVVNKPRLLESYTNLTQFTPCKPLAAQKYLYVYKDDKSVYNAYVPSGFMGDFGALSVSSDTASKFAGTSAMRWRYSGLAPQNQLWSGVYFQAPAYFWGDRIGGYDLTGASALTFYAKGTLGREKLKFFLGGITGPYHDSLMPTKKTADITLTSAWKKYTIPLTGLNLSRMGGGFGFSLEQAKNPSGTTFYLDEIRFENLNLAGGIYTPTPDDFPVDAYAMLAGHTYDNAMALNAFISSGDSTDAIRARLLADSIVWAQQHDEIKDGRIRNVYYPDNLATGTTYGNTGNQARHNVDFYGNGAGPGNMSWTMIALLNYYQKFGGSKYLISAQQMGQWIVNNCYDTRGKGGYTAGYNGWPPANVQKLTYKSTEHNIDVYVAFMRLYQITGNTVWRQRALHAKVFVEAMWDDAGAFFYTGTIPDGVTLNKDNFPVDVMPWGYLALGNATKYGRGLPAAKYSHYVKETIGAHTFEGVDFNKDQDGIFWEGTAHMVTAFWQLYYHSTGTAQANARANAVKFQNELREAQLYAPRTNSLGLVAANHDKLTTGFDLPTGGAWYYFNRLHVGATAWMVLSEQRWNPYWGIPVSQAIPF